MPDETTAVDELRALIGELPDSLLPHALQLAASVLDADERHEVMLDLIERLSEPDQDHGLDLLVTSLKEHGRLERQIAVWLSIAEKFRHWRATAMLAALDGLERLTHPTARDLVRLAPLLLDEGLPDRTFARFTKMADALVAVGDRITVSIALIASDPERYLEQAQWTVEALRSSPSPVQANLVADFARVAPSKVADEMLALLESLPSGPAQARALEAMFSGKRAFPARVEDRALTLAGNLDSAIRRYVFGVIAAGAAPRFARKILEAAYESNANAVVAQLTKTLGDSPDKLITWLVAHPRAAPLTPILSLVPALDATQLRRLLGVLEAVEETPFRFRLLIASAGREDVFTPPERVALIADSVRHGSVHLAVVDFMGVYAHVLARNTSRLADGANGLARVLQQPAEFLYRILNANVGDVPSETVAAWIRIFQVVSAPEFLADCLPALAARASPSSLITISRAVLALRAEDRPSALARLARRLDATLANWALENLPADASLDEIMTLFPRLDDAGQVAAWQRLAHWPDRDAARAARNRVAGTLRGSATMFALQSGQASLTSAELVGLIAVLPLASWSASIAHIFVDHAHEAPCDLALSRWPAVVTHLDEEDIPAALRAGTQLARAEEPAVEGALTLPLAARLGGDAPQVELKHLLSRAATPDSLKALGLVAASVDPALVDQVAPELVPPALRNVPASLLGDGEYAELARIILSIGSEQFVKRFELRSSGDLKKAHELLSSSAAGTDSLLLGEAPNLDEIHSALSKKRAPLLDEFGTFFPHLEHSVQVHEVGSEISGMRAELFDEFAAGTRFRLTDSDSVSFDEHDVLSGGRFAFRARPVGVGHTVTSLKSALDRVSRKLEPPTTVHLNAWFDSISEAVLVEDRPTTLYVTVGDRLPESLLPEGETAFRQALLSPLVTFRFIVQCPGCDVEAVEQTYRYGTDKPAEFRLRPEEGSAGVRNLVIVVFREDTTVHVSKMAVTILNQEDSISSFASSRSSSAGLSA